ncbi:MAG: hypothetical protein M1831_000161 [Alyxoria varia]|nr:MAG: hypothetical protein M1831_000161 [Alyxoria varia]
MAVRSTLESTRKMTSLNKISAIESLPRELQFELLSFLPDSTSLKAAALSCPSLYISFAANEARLSKQAVLNHIDDELLNDALAILELSNLQEWTERNASEIVSRYIRHGNSFALDITTLSQALAIGRLHDCVLYFTHDFVAKALETHQVLPIDGTYNPFPGSSEISQNESVRIQHSLYRWNIFCYLFGHVKKAPVDLEDHDKVFEMFWSRFAPWENEQLACLFDYFHKVLAPVFSKIVDRSNSWLGFMGICGQARHLVIHYQALKGLERVRDILAASPQRLEDTHFFGYKAGDHKTEYWLKHTFRHAHERNPYDIYLKDCDEDDEKAKIKPPAFSDPDPGPEAVWRWAHQSNRAATWALGQTHKPLRERGYVMWDLARLNMWHRFQQAWVWEDQRETLMALRRQKVEATEILERRAKGVVSWL